MHLTKQAFSPDLKYSQILTASPYDCDGATTNCTTQLDSSKKGSANESGRGVHRQLFMNSSPDMFLDSESKSRAAYDDVSAGVYEIPPFETEKPAKSKKTN